MRKTAIKHNLHEKSEKTATKENLQEKSEKNFDKIEFTGEE